MLCHMVDIDLAPEIGLAPGIGLAPEIDLVLDTGLVPELGCKDCSRFAVGCKDCSHLDTFHWNLAVHHIRMDPALLDSGIRRVTVDAFLLTSGSDAHSVL